MIRFLILSLSCLWIMQSPAFSQSGYMGKKHEVSFDLANPLLQGMYQLEYKFSIEKHLSLVANYAMQNYENSLPNKSLTIGNSTFSGGHINSEGSMFGLGVAYNSPTAGMAMPIGYYFSFTYQRINNDLNEHFEETDEPLTFEHSGNLLQFTYGRNYNIYKNINLSLNLNLGIYFGSIEKPENFSGKTIDSEDDINPREFYPMAIPFIQGGREIPGSLGITMESGYLKYYAMPRVQVGYMF